MEFERASMAQVSEIERLIQAGTSNRQIAQALQCRRTLVASVRAQQITQERLRQAKKGERQLPPGWALQVDWSAVEKDIREGYQIKRIWEEVALGKTSHSNFFKYVKLRFASLLDQTVCRAILAKNAQPKKSGWLCSMGKVPQDPIPISVIDAQTSYPLREIEELCCTVKQCQF